MITTNTKYTRTKVSETRYEFHFWVFPNLAESGIAVGYGVNVKEARTSVNVNPEFLQWYKEKTQNG